MYLQDGEGRIHYISDKYSRKEAFQVAESLRFFIETKQFTGISKLTASFGVALYEQGTTREELMQRADIALYEAKKWKESSMCV